SRLRCVRPAHSTLRAPSPSLDPGHEPIERASRAGPARQEPLLDAPVPCCHPEHEARTDSLQLGIALAPAVALGIEGAAQVVDIALETRDTDRRLLARDAVMLECALELLELSRRALALSSESVEGVAALLHRGSEVGEPGRQLPVLERQPFPVHRGGDPMPEREEERGEA